MAELKTKRNRKSVAAFIKSIENDKRREDCAEVAKMMEQITKEKPVMWGDSIIGFGTFTYSNTTGKDIEWMATGLSPRKQNLTVYIMSGFKKHGELMAKLGKYKTGKSCLYINKLEDVDKRVLKSLIRESVKHVKKNSIEY